MVPSFLPYKGKHPVLTFLSRSDYTQHPLHLPSNSELHVSLWRLTDKGRVWYEWYAESFLPTPALPTAAPAPVLPTHSPVKQGLSILTTPIRVASPLIDAYSPQTLISNFASPSDYSKQLNVDSALATKPVFTLVKLGSTALHNPNGRSSWIGL